jgi:hypothetical protein
MNYCDFCLFDQISMLIKGVCNQNDKICDYCNDVLPAHAWAPHGAGNG